MGGLNDVQNIHPFASEVFHSQNYILLPLSLSCFFDHVYGFVSSHVFFSCRDSLAAELKNVTKL